MFNSSKRKRNMRKIFQWREYLNWKKMNSTQKINFKRACLFPVLVYFVYVFLFKYSMSILILFGIYFLVRFSNRNKLKK